MKTDMTDMTDNTGITENHGTDRAKPRLVQVHGIPRVPFYGAIAFIVISAIAAIVGRTFDVGTVHSVKRPSIETIALRFEDRNDGSVAVYNAKSNAQVHMIEPGTHNFLRVVLRALVRDRKARKIGSEPPFYFHRHAKGIVTIEDRSLGRILNMRAFGKTNMQSVDRLMKSSKVLQTSRKSDD